MTQREIDVVFYQRERSRQNKFMVCQLGDREQQYNADSHLEALTLMEKLLSEGATTVTLYCNEVQVFTVTYHRHSFPAQLVHRGQYPVPNLSGGEMLKQQAQWLTIDPRISYGVSQE